MHSDPDILGGTAVFAGTRVPVQTLIDCIETGHPLQQFLDNFPIVSRGIAIAALEQAKAHLMRILLEACVPRALRRFRRAAAR